MLTTARAALSRLMNAAAFVLIIFGGVALGCALNVAEELESEIKKRTQSQRSQTPR